MLDPRTSELLKNYMIAGGSVGAGVGIGTSLANYFTYLRNKAKSQKSDSSQDDDILYVDVPHTKQAGVSSWIGAGGGMAIAGGTLSMVAANALVKSLYNKIKKRELQKDLDESQQMYWDAEAGPGVSKSASMAGKPMSTPEMVAGTVPALTILAAVASGLVTNKALSHYFPARDAGLDPIKDARPKQVKIRYTDDIAKQASDKELASAMDFVVSSLHGGFDKSASFIPDLIHQTATGGLEEFLENVHTVGTSAALDLIKGASDYTVSDDDRYLAIATLNRHPETAPLMATLVEVEVLDNLPSFHKIAYELDRDDANVLTKIAAAVADDVAEGVIDRKTDKDKPELSENGKDEVPSKKGGYALLSSVLEQHKDKKSEDGEEDVLDKVFSGQ
jgi:hypothetical protein